MAEYVSPEIKTVISEEPMREGEYPHAYQVGYNGVTHITEDSQNCGTYAIGWFNVWADKHLVAKLNSMYVSAVIYKEKN